MKALFRKVAKSTGNAAYSPDVAGRSLLVNFSLQSGARRRTQDDGKLPLAFTLSITQSYSGQDPIALTGIQ